MNPLCPLYKEIGMKARPGIHIPDNIVQPMTDFSKRESLKAYSIKIIVLYGHMERTANIKVLPVMRKHPNLAA